MFFVSDKKYFAGTMKKSLTNLENGCMFVPDFHTRGRVHARQKIAGFFYAQNLEIFGSVPPCRGLMALLPMWWKSTGKAEPFFISANKQIVFGMTSTENTCLQRNNSTLSATPTASEMAAPLNQLQTLDDFTGIMQVKGCTQVKIHFKARKVTIGFHKEGRGYGVRGNSLTEAFQAVVHMITNPLTA
jgi:hypothetical protein